MKFITKSILFILLFFSTASIVMAQNSILDSKDLSQITADTYSDQELQSMLDKAAEMNMSEDVLFRELNGRGMKADEITKLKARLSGFEKNPKKESNEEEIKSEKSQEKINIPKQDEMQELNKDLSIFGSELFTKSSLVFEPNIRIATPSNYVLGPDDEIIMNIYGYSEKRYNLTVSPEGEIYIPNVGPILVNGLSIEQATKKIKSKLASTIYQAINSGRTSVQISLGKIKSIRVTIIGQAEKPGTYTISSLTTLYNVLYLCGGPNDQGSYRNIQLFRQNKLERTADLYSFLSKGNQSDNVLLQEGDLIKIPYYKERVTINGAVKREGKFEMLEGESFENLLEYCGGFKDLAYKENLTVYRLTEKNRKIIDLNALEFSQFIVKSGDVFQIKTIGDEYANKVKISGSVYMPGDYELKENTGLLDIIKKAGGLKEDAYKNRITIYRYYNNKVPFVSSYKLDSLIQSGTDVSLQKNDKIIVNSIFDFKDFQYVQIQGNVRNPIQTEWKDKMTLKDLITLSGGINHDGDSTNIEIVRKIKEKSNNLNETESFIFNIETSSNDFILEPYDMIFVKNQPRIIKERNVIVEGEVVLPGRYILNKTNERISDIIKRVGGFKASADSNSIIIKRIFNNNIDKEQRERIIKNVLTIPNDTANNNIKMKENIYRDQYVISLDLDKIMDDNNSPDNLLLEDGDYITIAKNSNLVKVNGEVYFQTFSPIIKGKHAKFYIKQAGGFLNTANKSKVFVIYPNGKVKSVKSFLFIKRYPKILPKSEIFVPKQNDKNKSRISVTELSIAMSALAVIANIIINLKK